MKEYVLIRYLKSSSRDFRFKRKTVLPDTPQIECGIKLEDGSFFLVRCLTFCEDGRIFILVDDDHSIRDNDIDERIKEYEADGWALSDYENND